MLQFVRKDVGLLITNSLIQKSLLQPSCKELIDNEPINYIWYLKFEMCIYKNKHLEKLSDA